MIIWLASYPRSGNTLLRTLIHSVTGLPSYIDDPHQGRVASELTRQKSGHVNLPKPWAKFYREATASKEVFLVKTHRAPIDNQPAIYVVRDGRSASMSYLKYHRTFFPEAARTLLDLIVGNDIYGDWSSHARIWRERPEARLLVVRFEELLACTPERAQEIASFIGFGGEVQPWHNPQGDLQKENPDFIGKGLAHWQPPEEWTPWLNSTFFSLHGALMIELGFCEAGDVTAASQCTEPPGAAFLTEIAARFRQVAGERWYLQDVCEKRQVGIDKLAAKIRTLTQEQPPSDSLLSRILGRLSSSNRRRR